MQQNGEFYTNNGYIDQVGCTFLQPKQAYKLKQKINYFFKAKNRKC